MEAPTRRSAWSGAAVALLFGLTLTWALLRFGAAETPVAYRVLLMLLLPAVVALLSPPFRGRVDLRFIALALLGLFLLAQVSLRPTLEARGYVHLALGWMSLWLSLWLASRGRQHRRFLVLLLILLGAFEAVYGLAQSLAGYDYIGGYFRNRGRIASGTLINRNHYAALLNMILPLALGVLYADYGGRQSPGRPRSESLAKTWLVLLGCSFAGLGVLLSQSRGGTLSLLATLLFVGLLLALSRRRTSRRRLSAAAATVLAFLILGMGAVLGLEALFERFGRFDEGLSRVQVYRDTLTMIADHRGVGVGPGMYRWRFRPYQTASPQSLFDHAHNDYLEAAAEWGIGLAVLGWAFVLWRFLRASEIVLNVRDSRRQGLSLGCAAALFSILVHSLVDFSLQIPAVLMVFGCVLGLAWSLEFVPRSPRRAEEEREPWSSRIDWGVGGIGSDLALRALLLIALGAAGWQVLQRSRAEQSARPESGVAGLERAIEIDRTAPEPHYLLGMAYRDLPGAGDPERAVWQLQSAVRRNPYAWRYRLELSRAQELLGRHGEAEASLRRAVRLNPRRGEYRWRLANFLLRRGSTEEAIDEIETAVDLEPRLAEPAVALLLKSGAETPRIEELLPGDPGSLAALLRSLSRLDSAAAQSPELVARETLLESIWQRLLSRPEPPDLDAGYAYVDRLLRVGRYERARQRWIDLQRAHGVVDLEFESGRSGLWNGSFELPLTGGPLGWQLGRSDAFRIEQAAAETREGSAALGIEFTGSENLSFQGLAQRVLLEPAAGYRLSFDLLVEEITTDEGLYFEVVSRRAGRQLAASEAVVGDADWRRFEIDFTSPQESREAWVRLRRRPSARIDNKLRGRVWIDSMRLERLGQ